LANTASPEQQAKDEIMKKATTTKASDEMPLEAIKQVLMRRDKMSEADADNAIRCAKEELAELYALRISDLSLIIWMSCTKHTPLN